MSTTSATQNHYGDADLRDRVFAALGQAQLLERPIAWHQLAPLDQFHVRALAATQELAEGLDLRAGQRVLDLGSGFGGPARFLAAVHGIEVVGIDLTPGYVELSTELTWLVGLDHQVTFLLGDAIELPFMAASFDHAWTQHVAMNIANKAQLYEEVYRVLKPGGRFAIYDVAQGHVEPVIYPAPWADDETTSFLSTPDAMTEMIGSAGLSIVSYEDTTELALSWFAEMRRASQSSDGPGPLNLLSILGPTARQAAGNVAKNLTEGRLRMVQVIAQKP